jgi:MATE family multidrug resistance protein
VTETRRELREQWQLSVPLALGHLAQHLMGLVDTALLGRYSDTALAGAGIGNSLTFAITVFGLGAVMGLDTLIPQALGAGEDGRARRLLDQGAWLAVLVGLPLTAIAAAMPLLLPVAGVEAEVADQAAIYLWWRLPAIIPFLVFVALRSYLQALGLTRPIVLSMVIGNIVNVGADLTLIFGVDSLGIPALGATGAAVATSVVSLATMLVLVAVVRAANTPDQLGPPDPTMRRRIFGLGWPVGSQLVVEVGIFALASVGAGRLGTVPAGAHQVALTLISFTFAVAIGIGAATSVRVGRAVGRADPPATRRAGLTGLGFGAGFMTLTALLFLLVPAELARLFTDDGAVIAAAVPLIRIGAVFQLSDGAQAIAAGALRGAGDTRSPLWGNVVGHYAIGVPVMLGLAFAADYGAPGLWWGLSAGLTATAVILIARFLFISARPIERA